MTVVAFWHDSNWRHKLYAKAASECKRIAFWHVSELKFLVRLVKTIQIRRGGTYRHHLFASSTPWYTPSRKWSAYPSPQMLLSIWRLPLRSTIIDGLYVWSRTVLLGQFGVRKLSTSTYYLDQETDLFMFTCDDWRSADLSTNFEAIYLPDLAREHRYLLRLAKRNCCFE